MSEVVISYPALQSFDSIEPTEVNWLWPYRIPLGRYTLICGRQGIGKSFLTCDIAARITRGGPWPDGSQCPSGSVIMIGSEDGSSDTIRPRLDASGADVSKVHLLDGYKTTNSEETFDHHWTLERVDILRMALEEVTDCKAVIVDPIGDFIGNINANSDNEVRNALKPFCRLMDEFGVAGIIVGHSRKSTAKNADDSVMGSRAFTALARVVYHVFEDPEDRDRKLLLQGKNNICKHQNGLSYAIEGKPAKCVFGDSVTKTADEVIQEIESSGKPKSKIAKAKDWILEFLADGPKAGPELETRSAAFGIALKTLQRARKDLNENGEVEKTKSAKGWIWSLSDQLRQVSVKKIYDYIDEVGEVDQVDRQLRQDRQHSHSGELAILPGAQETQICECGAQMVPSEQVNGWQNYDCPNCSNVRPVESKGQHEPENHTCLLELPTS